jgi:hypothetical protein
MADERDRPSNGLTPEEQRRFRELMAGLDGQVDVEALEAEVSSAVSRRTRFLAAVTPVLDWWWLSPLLVLTGLVVALVGIRSSILFALPGVMLASLGVWLLARLVRRTITRLGPRRPADRGGRSPGRHSAGDRGSDPA